MIIGLTGGIATGKSTVLNIFKQHNFIIFNSDTCVANLTNTNQNIIKQIQNTFANVVQNNVVNKQLLKQTIYANYLTNIVKLEQIIVPQVIKEINLFINANKNNNIVIEAPLLFEYNLNKLCNVVIATFCSKNKQIARVIARNNLTIPTINAIIKKQINLKNYTNKINFTINTNYTINHVNKQVLHIIKQLGIA